jgi:hypothetical protein
MENRRTEGAKGDSPSGNQQGEALVVGLVVNPRTNARGRTTGTKSLW